MNRVRVAAAVCNQTPLDWEGNRRNLVASIDAARAAGARVLCLPEMGITGYGCEDAFHSPSVLETAWEVLEELLPETAGMIVCLGLPVLHDNRLFNTVAVAADGRLAGLVAKRYLAGEGIHYEPRWFKPWPAGRRSTVELGAAAVPIGDLVFDCGGLRIGFEICEDAWVASRPGRSQFFRGVDLILNPSASHFAFDKLDVRRRFVLEGSRAFGVGYVYANLLGNEAGRVIYDGGAIIASGGSLLALGPRLGFVDHAVTCAVIDVERNRMSQARSADFDPLAFGDDGGRVRVAFDWPEIEPETTRPASAGWETGPHRPQEELARAVALGLFDYLRKSRSRGFVVSLSGGADSTAVACLVALGARLALRELGPEAVARKLAHVPGAAALVKDEKSLVRALLLTVYQATRNSGRTTREAARAVAEALGAEHMDLDVDPLVQGYTSTIEKAIGRALAWASDDVALQNIQARVRGPSVWMLANLRNALLLATSNRSEAAVGYATMDGDTCGGLSPVAGIDKAFLRRWLRWLETTGPEEIGPIPELRVVTAQEPTAELRPPESGQTDEADLMPYDLLDAIERAAIGDKKGPLDVFRLVRAGFEQYDDAQLAGWVERFYRLWCRNQWKRERYAPSFHLDDRNLDPKTWCRFPILSGGFERELEELRAFVQVTRGELRELSE